MKSHDHDYVEIRAMVPRDALVQRLPSPDIVTQHNALHTVGLQPRQFLELLRTASLPVIKAGRTRGVRRELLLAYLETLMKHPTANQDPSKPTSLADLLGLEACDE